MMLCCPLPNHALRLLVLVGAIAAQSRYATAQSEVEPRVVVAKKAVAKDSSLGQQPPLPDPPLVLPAAHHPWARFRPGAWRTLRTTTESFDDTGSVVSRCETTQTETLIAVGENDYTIEATSVVQIGGKRLRGAAQRETRQLLTDTAGKPTSATRLASTELNLGGQSIPVQRWRLATGSGPHRRVETVLYSPAVSPFILQREASSADGTGESNVLQKTIAVEQIETPVLLEQGIVAGCQVKVVTQTGAHRIERSELRSDAAPGGLIAASSTERDTSGKRVRWSTTSLVEFGKAAEQREARTRWRLLRRRNEGPQPQPAQDPKRRTERQTTT